MSAPLELSPRSVIPRVVGGESRAANAAGPQWLQQKTSGCIHLTMARNTCTQHRWHPLPAPKGDNMTPAWNTTSNIRIVVQHCRMSGNNDIYRYRVSLCISECSAALHLNIPLAPTAVAAQPSGSAPMCKATSDLPIGAMANTISKVPRQRKTTNLEPDETPNRDHSSASVGLGTCGRIRHTKTVGDHGA